MKQMKTYLPLLALAVLELSACGPRITEVRMMHFPPRNENCALALVPNIPIEDMSPGGDYQVVGHLVLQETGVQYPFSERYAKIIRPRACAMGGEIVTVGVSAISQGMGGSGTGTGYVVLRRKGQQPHRSSETSI